MERTSHLELPSNPRQPLEKSNILPIITVCCHNTAPQITSFSIIVHYLNMFVYSGELEELDVGGRHDPCIVWCRLHKHIYVVRFNITVLCRFLSRYLVL